MAKERPERKLVVEAIMENPRRKAHEIADQVGLIQSVGYDKAVDYVRRVKKAMRIKGQIQVGAYAADEDRLEDITTLFELRKGEMSRGAAYIMLMLNCYYRLRSEDDNIHMMAIDDTYEKNKAMKTPFPMIDAIRICDGALSQYMRSIDEIKNMAARRRGYPGAGLNYTDDRFIEKLEITDSELEYMKSIRKGKE